MAGRKDSKLVSFSIKLEQLVSRCLSHRLSFCFFFDLDVFSLVSCSLFQAQDIHLSDGDPFGLLGAEDRPQKQKEDCVSLFHSFEGCRLCSLYQLHDLNA